MPNRILKESICTSENVDELTSFQETFFYRMIVNCDDFGRMDARPKVLAARLFPLKDIASSEVVEALEALSNADLIILYAVDGKPFLQMRTWDRHQQVRAKRSKYPSPDDGIPASENICKQLISNDFKSPRDPIQSNRESESITTTRIEADVDDVGEDLLQIRNDHNEILDAAQAAGFPGNQATFDKIIGLYADYGKEIVLQGISACVDQGKTTIAYLKGCCHHAMEGTGKPAAGGKRNPFVDMLEGVAANG